MKAEYLNTFYLSTAFLSLFGFAEFLHLVIKLKAEITRKIVHVGTGVLTMLFPILVQNQWLVLLLCASFAGILTLSMRFNFLKGINAIDRKSHGSISYPAAVYLTYLFYDFQEHHLLYFYLPVLTMALCDPIAALVGKKTNFVPLNIFGEKKTVGGFLGFLFASIIVSTTLLMLNPCSAVNTIVLIVICACLSATTELFTTKGFDNITIPFSVMISILISQQF